jgi:hypothetical protein
MDAETRQRDAATAKFLFDPSKDWFQISKPMEPDFAVDGLHKPSIVERLLAVLARRQA